MSPTDIVVALVGMVTAIVVAYIGTRPGKKADANVRENILAAPPVYAVQQLQADNQELRRILAAKADADYVTRLEERFDRAERRLIECEEMKETLERRLRRLENKNA